MNYKPIDIIIDRQDDEYQVQINSPMGRATHRFSLPFTEQDLEIFILKVGPTRRTVRRLNSPQMQLVQDFGQKLFNAIFDDQIYGRYSSSLDQAQIQGQGVRIAIETQDAPELNNLPWEFLYEQATDRFLALSKFTPIVRFLNLPQPVLPLETTRPLRVLGMVSSPKGVAELDVAREQRQLEEALARRIGRGDLAIDWLPTASLTELRRALQRNQYHIFHFTGHGVYDAQHEEGALLVEDEDDNARLVPASVLGTLLRDHATLRLAVLNACEGARTGIADPFGGVAPSLVRAGLPAVVAMQFEVTDKAAITFAREFYGGVALGLPVYTALSEARLAIYTTDNDMEWGTPVLFTRVENGVIFRLPPPATAPEETPTQRYARIVDLVRQEAWQEAVTEWEALRRMDPNFPDSAQAIELARRQMEALDLYERMDRLVATRQWQGALETWQEIRARDNSFADSRDLVETAQQGLAAAEQQAAHRRRVQRMYSEVSGLAAIEQWQRAKDRWDEICKLEPGFPDSQGIMARVEKALEEERAARAAEQAAAQEAARRAATTDTNTKTQESPEAEKKSGRGCLRIVAFAAIAGILIVIAVIVFSIRDVFLPGAAPTSAPTPLPIATATPIPPPTLEDLIIAPTLESNGKDSEIPFALETPIATLMPAIVPPPAQQGTGYPATDYLPMTLGSYWNFVGISCSGTVNVSTAITYRSFFNGFDTIAQSVSATDATGTYYSGSWLQWAQGALFLVQEEDASRQVYSYSPAKPIALEDLSPGTTWSWQGIGPGGPSASSFEVLESQTLEWGGQEIETLVVRESFNGVWCGQVGSVVIDNHLGKNIGILGRYVYLNGELATQIELLEYYVAP